MFLKTIDMLSPKITLYYKQKNTHNSAISGILTILAYILILGYALIFLLKYINKENPTAYFFNRYVEDVGVFSFKSFHFFNYIQFLKSGSRETIDADFTKIEIIGINATLDIFLENEKNLTHWVYGKCDNGVNLDEIEYLLNKEIYFKSACLKKFYNNQNGKYYDINDDNFEWPVIKHGASNPNVSFYGIIIRKCMNSSFGGNCSTEEDINNYLHNAYLNFNILDHNIDILSYKNPIIDFFHSITSALTRDSYIVNNLNFNPSLVRNYWNSINFLNDKPYEQSTYSFHENSKTTTNEENTNILGVFFIWMQNSQQYYQRNYKKLQEMLSEIGGFANIVILIAKCINYLIARFNMLSDTQELLTNIINKNVSIYEKLIKTKTLKKFIGENNHKMNEENITIKKRESRKNNKEILNIENSLNENNNSNNKIINQRINVINNNNLGEETNRVNKNNNENSEQNIILEQKPKKDIGKLKRFSTRHFIRRDFALIDRKEKLNCFYYIFYIIFCKQVNSKIKYYEELRRLIISEECMIQNYLNIYKLLEAQDIT